MYVKWVYNICSHVKWGQCTSLDLILEGWPNCSTLFSPLFTWKDFEPHNLHEYLHITTDVYTLPVEKVPNIGGPATPLCFPKGTCGQWMLRVVFVETVMYSDSCVQYGFVLMCLLVYTPHPFAWTSATNHLNIHGRIPRNLPKWSILYR